MPEDPLPCGVPELMTVAVAVSAHAWVASKGVGGKDRWGQQSDAPAPACLWKRKQVCCCRVWKACNATCNQLMQAATRAAGGGKERALHNSLHGARSHTDFDSGRVCSSPQPGGLVAQ